VTSAPPLLGVTRPLDAPLNLNLVHRMTGFYQLFDNFV
jgi:hypothetical protein